MTDLHARRLSPESIMRDYRTGDDDTWMGESLYLWRSEPERMNELTNDIVANGIREPVLLGDDGRVWDGHHRIIIAAGLGLKSIPVTLAEELRNV